MIYTGKSKSQLYKHVYNIEARSKARGFKSAWRACITINGIKHQKGCNTEIEAAKAVDMFLIGKGREPVNVLKRK